jgi:SAM-dependent methyltransferase
MRVHGKTAGPIIPPFTIARADNGAAEKGTRDGSQLVKTVPPPLHCPLCQAAGHLTTVRGDDDRRYHRCDSCSLIFVDPAHHLSPAAEKAFYRTHENSIDNAGYVRFLNRIVDPMLAHLAPGMRGLDYGSGPGPTLSRLLRRQGIACDDYDPFFADHPPRPPYDFIFSTECFEHFHHPAKEIERIHALLKPGAPLAIMTERWTSLEAFARWHYTRDPTHVCFFHAGTIDFICRRFDFSLLWKDERRVAILRRNDGPQ